MTFAREVGAGERFEFGRNWRRFLSSVTEQKIQNAINSLVSMMETNDLRGLRLLDIGCGSGLSSLAARRLGARVHSFDYDPESVACTLDLRNRFYPQDNPALTGGADGHGGDWVVEQGSALDGSYLRSLGSFDIVYSWGVLHHTGAMWKALENAMIPLAAGGTLFIAIYNDQGTHSRRWRAVKRLYNRMPRGLRFLVVIPVAVHQWWRRTLKDFLRLRPFSTWRSYSSSRGMSPWRDVIDWVGGYPFEVARPEEIFDFYRKRNCELIKLKTCGGSLGCNEFVFRRSR
jgi:2-polyprenyl-3-methyl-5-hydroxy-6-metoxy-1,4-benzoquinol methylase